MTTEEQINEILKLLREISAKLDTVNENLRAIQAYQL